MILQASKLSKSYSDSKFALNDISFTIDEPGKIYGFIGPNGAGKTTLIRILSTQLHLTDGTVEVLGYDIQKQKNEIRKQISVLPQDVTPVFYELSIKEMIYYYLRIRGYSKKYISSRMSEILDLFGLANYQDKKLVSLSGGLFRRCFLSLTLGVEASIYFLDEPTVGLDPSSKLFVWSALQKLVKKGKTILLTSHYIEEISQLCSIVFVLDQGKVLVSGNPADIVKNQFNGISNKIMINLDIINRDSVLNIVNTYEEHINIQNEIVFIYTNDLNRLVDELTSLRIHFEIAPVTLEDVALKLENGGKNAQSG